MMQKTERQFYEAPLTEVFKVAQEGVICASETMTDGDPTYNGFDTEEEW